MIVSDGKTIIACSSGAGNAVAISIIRLSGFSSLNQFSNFFSTPTEKWAIRKMIYTNILQDKVVVDDICACFFESPHSYTGDNLLELYVHGNPLNVERIIQLFLSLDFVREARPGEFSLRALQNKRLTLSQIEGLDVFLNASSYYALEQGRSLLSGELQEKYLSLLSAVKRHRSSLEILIDFSDDVGEETAKAHFYESLDDIQHLLKNLYQRVTQNSEVLLSPEIVVAGLPNAGKSSFFNFILGQNRAIVSRIAGTTRDYLTEKINIEGVNYSLIDTAGLRESEDVIESEGITRARNKVGHAFFRILIVNPFDPNHGLEATMADFDFDVVLVSHSDLSGFELAFAPLGAVLEKYKIEVIKTNFVYTKNDELKVLKALIARKYSNFVAAKPILVSRHKDIIATAFLRFEAYSTLTKSESDLGILSSEIHYLQDCLSELIGIVSPDLVLNNIFENFCIGK